MPQRLHVLNGGAHPSDPAPAGAAPAGVDATRAQMRERCIELAQRVAKLTLDLGGLAYEMAIRDHYRLDVLSRRAAELQQADAELAALERLLSGAESGVSGQCRACGVVHARGASFCWHCGAALQHEAQPGALTEVLPPIAGS